MNTTSKLILLEFNELSPALMNQFMNQGSLPAFKKYHDEAAVFVSSAEEKQENLEPWIQWITIHTGLKYDEHGVFRLGEGHKITQPRIWDLTSEKGLTSLIVGSMNVGHPRQHKGVLVPDAWNADVPPIPTDVEPYLRFVQHHVQEHTNASKRIGVAGILAFLKFMLSRGLSSETIMQIIRQLATENRNGTSWKRVAILDSLQYDFFQWHFRRLSPSFSTFFLNSTAHLQHMYWRNFQPEIFEVKPTSEEQRKYKGAVLFGYQNMDRLVGKFLKLADDGGANLVLATALSQQPCLLYESIGGKTFYRPHDFEKVCECAGVIDAHRCEPVMSEEFYVHFNSEAEAIENEAKVSDLEVNGHRALHVERRGASLFMGCRIFTPVSLDATIRRKNEAEGTTPFFKVFYRVEDKKSGMHHPDGMFWIRTVERKHFISREKVPLTAIAPTLLELMNIKPPESMRGSSLLVA